VGVKADLHFASWSKAARYFNKELLQAWLSPVSLSVCMQLLEWRQ